MKALQRSGLCSAHMLTRLQCRSRVWDSQPYWSLTQSDLKGLCNAADSSSWMQASAYRYMAQAADGQDVHAAAQAEAPDRFSAEYFSNSPEPPPAVLQVPPSLLIFCMPP